jgi:hypothetical protein
LMVMFYTRLFFIYNIEYLFYTQVMDIFLFIEKSSFCNRFIGFNKDFSIYKFLIDIIIFVKNLENNCKN